MAINGRSPWPPKSGQRKEECLYRKQSIICVEMFLDEYPLWEVGGLHHPIILQGMFVHGSELGQKEAERLICQGCWHGLLKLDPEAYVPAIQLVGY